MRDADAGAFARKLRAAVDESGSRSLAEFVARVRASVPATGITLDRAYKWLQGRATPQHPGVYDDLAAALGLGGDGASLRDSTVEAFVQRLRARPGGAAASALAAVVDMLVPSGLRDGAYAAYSLARHVGSGSVVRGSVHVATDPAGGGRRVDYIERDGAQQVMLSGALVTSRRLHTVTFAPSPRDEALSLVLAVPGQPVPVVGGLMIGQAQYAVAARPICCRVLLLAVRNPAADPEAGNGELGLDADGIADDVAAIGYGGSDCPAVAEQILAYLTAPSAGQLDVSHQAVEAVSLMVALAKPMTGAA